MRKSYTGDGTQGLKAKEELGVKVWRDALVLKNTGCSFGAFDSQHLHSSLQLSITPVSEDLKPSSDFCRHQKHKDMLTKVFCPTLSYPLSPKESQRYIGYKLILFL